mmetsp:Transcript_1479/g.1497  ORF Transcript_1479/g.1497 Transcript_1479/m.1497 type:complete len:110 (-) Transcript_1479:19-348(-)
MLKVNLATSKLEISNGSKDQNIQVFYAILNHSDSHSLNMIRLHSFYPWHDKRAYTHFECPEDAETLKWVKEFNKFDLYSKGDAVPDVESLKPYYSSLLKKYNLDGKLKW